MNTKVTLAVVSALLCAQTIWASGFSLYQPSVVSHAMGGALVGKAMDASANFNNPATLTDLTNIWVTVGFITEHPRGQVRGRTNGVSWGGDQACDAGLFWLPHFQLAVPLPHGFAFGLSGSPEYGLGTSYGETSPIAWSATDTTVLSFTLNPNLAYKITDKWSVAVGLRWLYFDFDQYKRPSATAYANADYPQAGSCRYLSEYHLHGNNRCESLGWVVGTKYDIFDNLAVGLVYKSAIDVNVRGDTTMDVLSTTTAGPYGAQVEKAVRAKMRQMNADADAELTLPQSLTGGINWDVAKNHHLGLAVSWTQWSEFDTLMFNVKPQTMPVYLNWNDTWRGSIGYAWDFAEGWKWMISYVFDQDCCLNKDQSSAMLPPAHRNIATTGFVWNIWRNMDIAFDYSCIFMDGGSFDTTNSQTGDHVHVEVCRGFCHAAGFSITYRF